MYPIYEESVRSPRTRAVDHCKLPSVGTGNQTQVLTSFLLTHLSSPSLLFLYKPTVLRRIPLSLSLTKHVPCVQRKKANLQLLCHECLLILWEMQTSGAENRNWQRKAGLPLYHLLETRTTKLCGCMCVRRDEGVLALGRNGRCLVHAYKSGMDFDTT